MTILQGDSEYLTERRDQRLTGIPEDLYTWLGAAAMAYMGRDFARAAEWAQRSIELAPNSDLWYWHDARTLRGIALLRSGDRARGLAALQEARDKQERLAELGAGEDDISLWHLSAIHAALGDRDAALEHWQWAYDLGFGSPDGRQSTLPSTAFVTILDIVG